MKPSLLDVLRPPTSLPGEEWRPAGAHVFVSNRGRVWSHRYKRFLKCCASGSGYRSIQVDGKPQYLHRVLAEVFLGPEPFPGAVVRHLNDVPDDNRIENLAWGTRADNSRDAIRNSRLVNPRGEAHAKAKLKESEVRQIRAFYSYGFWPKEMSAWYGVSTEAINAIVRRRNWRHVE